MKYYNFRHALIPPLQGSLPATHGINILGEYIFRDYYQNKKTAFHAAIWDFGGQEEQYLTHQYFFGPRSLYVLLVDWRKRSIDFDYWFRIISLMGKREDGQPTDVVVVLNEININQSEDISLHQYSEQFPHLRLHKQAVNLGRKPKERNDFRYHHLLDLIHSNFKDLPIIGIRLPIAYTEIKIELEKEKEAGRKFLPFSEFSKLCIEKGLESEDEARDYSGFLHALGEAVHYSHLKDEKGREKPLAQYVLLDPDWATKAIYDVLGHKSVRKNHGQFSRELLHEVWGEITPKEQQLLEKLLLEDAFEVCFPLAHDHHQLLAPGLLPKEPKDFDFSPVEKHGLRFRFNYPLVLPKGLISRLIVRLHELIEEDHYFRYGVILQHKNGSRARVEMLTTGENRKRVIDIWIDRTGPDARYLLRLIREEVEKIHEKSFQGIEVQELVPCICRECLSSDEPFHYDFTTILRRERKSQYEKERCGKSDEWIPIRSILEGTYPKEELETKGGYMIEDLERIKALVGNKTIIEKLEGPIHTGQGNQLVDVRSPTLPTQSWWRYIFEGIHLRSFFAAGGLSLAIALICYYFIPSLAQMAIPIFSIGLSLGAFWAFQRASKYYRFARITFLTGFGILGILNSIPFFDGFIKAGYQLSNGGFSLEGQARIDIPIWLNLTILVATAGLTAYLLWLDYKSQKT
ncbi:MAG: COR domain-containing protein [Bacteroidota bacterium]